MTAEDTTTPRTEVPLSARLAANPVTAWARSNLFSSWWNAILTLICVVLAFLALSSLLNWAVFDAIWSDVEAAVCKDQRAAAAAYQAQQAEIAAGVEFAEQDLLEQTSSGACWAIIHEKYRLILFGRYPFAEQWRPLIAMVLFVGLVGISCYPGAWGRPLMVAWPVGLVVCGLLMFGGVFGMEFVETALWGGLPLTLILSVFGCVLAFPIAILLALGRRSEMPIIKAICVGFIELIRGVPLITILFMASFMIPLFLPGKISVDKLVFPLLGFVIFTAAYLAEVIRGGLASLPRGQYEAADALGLSYWKKTRLIILPQALKKVIPPIVNTIIGAFKDTSLVVIISLTDLLLAARSAFSDPEWRPFFVEVYVFTALIYFVFCFSMSKYSQWLERDLAKGERR